MQTLHTLARGVVLLAGAYLVVLAAVALFAPASAARHLGAFAGTARLHYAELAVRGVVGAALVLQAPRMLLPHAFALFGWILLFTTAVLAIVPWRRHRAFALRAVPWATAHLTPFGIASLVLGGLVLVATLAGADGGAGR